MNVPFKCDDPDDNGKDGGSFKGQVPMKTDGTFGETKQDDFPPMPHAGAPTGLRYALKGELKGNRAAGRIEIEAPRLRRLRLRQGGLRGQEARPTGSAELDRAGGPRRRGRA